MKTTTALWYGASVPSDEGPFAEHVRQLLGRACGEDEQEATADTPFVQWWHRRNAIKKLARLRGVAFVELGEHHPSFGLAIGEAYIHRATGDEVAWVNRGSRGVAVWGDDVRERLLRFVEELSPSIDVSELGWRMASAANVRDDRAAIYMVELKDRSIENRYAQAQDAARFFGKSMWESGRYVFAAYERVPDGHAFILRPALTEEELATLNEQNSHLSIVERVT